MQIFNSYNEMATANSANAPISAATHAMFNGQTFNSDKTPAEIKRATDSVTRKTPTSDEIKQLNDVEDISWIRQQVHNMQDSFEDAELRLKQIERRVAASDSSYDTRDIERARALMEKRKAEFEKQKGRLERAESY
jgi:hypothetical protein